MSADSSSGESTAWMLALDDQHRAAVGERELIHLVERPTLLEVPLSPYYCRQAMLWNDLLLPTLDLAAWLHGQVGDSHQKLTGIVAYHSGQNVSYGALLLADIPERVQINDSQACPLPEYPSNWDQLAISCFRRGEKPIPILDLPYLFGGGLLLH